jgi:hypothetical protein
MTGDVTTIEQTNKEAPSSAPVVADNSKKTTGEKYYDRLKFGVAEVVILGATAAIAYVARYGDKKWDSINVFKWIQDVCEVAFSPLKKIGKDGGKLREIGTTIAGAAASTMVTFHGGNAFAPAMKWFEDKKKSIVDYFNARSGKPGELEVGREHLEKAPKQTWGDVIKGRFAAWGIVFASFVSAGILAGKDKHGMGRFDKFEEGFGRWVASFTKAGKELHIGLPGKTGIALHRELEGVAKSNRTYRFGKILALDIYATTAAILIWNAISKISAKKRQNAGESSPENSLPTPVTETMMAASDEAPRHHADGLKPKEGALSYAAMIRQQDDAGKEQAIAH